MPLNASLDPFPISVVLSLFVFIEGCLPKDATPTSPPLSPCPPPPLLGKLICLALERALGVVRDSPIEESALNRIMRSTVYNASDLILRSKDVLSPEKLLVSLILHISCTCTLL